MQAILKKSGTPPRIQQVWLDSGNETAHRTLASLTLYADKPTRYANGIKYTVYNIAATPAAANVVLRMFPEVLKSKGQSTLYINRK